LIDSATARLHHPALLPGIHYDSTFQVNIDYHLGYLISPQDCGQLESFTDITRCVASAAWSDNTVINQITRYTQDKLETLVRNATVRQRLGIAIEQETLADR
jgi:hypothetical protein